MCVCGMEQGKKGKEKGKEDMGKGKGAEKFREKGKREWVRNANKVAEASGKGAYEKGFDAKTKEI